jgi:hypothetical protein
MDMLVGEDFFVDQGNIEYLDPGTPGAHSDMMQMMTMGLRNEAFFYELVKDENKKIIYFTVGMKTTDGFMPFFTSLNHYDTAAGKKPYTEICEFTSLRFFKIPGTEDDPVAPGIKEGLTKKS